MNDLMNDYAISEEKRCSSFSVSDSVTEFILKKHQFNCYSIEMLLYPCIVIYERIFLVLTSDFPQCCN